MSVNLERKIWSTDEYEQMIRKGILAEDERVELIRGEVVKMAAIGPRHLACVILLQEMFHELLGRTDMVSTQNSIRLHDNSMPQPDIALLKRRRNAYADQLPTARDVLLLVEVVDSSLQADRTAKVPLYAEAGIPQVWLVNLEKGVVEVYSDPVNGSFEMTSVVQHGETLALPGGLERTLSVDDVLGF
ncbi:MAG: Uma2 family endonuclease [Chloroflexota bacterium]|nr:Uma2 family endonuclease [Chloroflexota bacterium]